MASVLHMMGLLKRELGRYSTDRMNFYFEAKSNSENSHLPKDDHVR